MEVLATGITSVFPLLVVGGEVEGQVSRGDESLGAQTATVGIQADAAVWTSTIREAAAGLAGRTFGRTVCFVHMLLYRRGRSVG